MTYRPTTATTTGIAAPSGSLLVSRSGGRLVRAALAVPQAEDFARWSRATFELIIVPGIKTLTASEATALAADTTSQRRWDLNSDSHLARAERSVRSHSDLVPASAGCVAADHVVRAPASGQEVVMRTDPDGPLLAPPR